jgi:hypothetical protein
VKDPAIAKAAYESYVHVYPDDLRPSVKGIALVLKELAKSDPKVAAAKPQDLVDTGPLDELVREGFFARLAAQH